MKVAALIILLSLVAACSSIVYTTDEALKMRRMTSKSILRVVLPDGGGGSGFVIIVHGDKMIVTNKHVCGEPPYSLQAVSDDTKERYPITPLITSESADLCISSILGADAIPPLSLADNDVEIGSKVYTLGYPMLRYLRLMEGQVEAYKYNSIPPMFATNMWVVPGQSGSPAFNRDREVIGVIFATELSTHSGYAIPVSVLKLMIAALEKNLDQRGHSASN